MNILDIRTIMIGYVLTNLVCLLVMTLLWRQSRGRISGTAFWLIDYAFQATALLLIVMRGAIPDWMSIVLSHTLILTGAMLGYMGLVRFVGERISQTPNILLIVFFTAIIGYFTFVSPDLGARTMSASLGLMILCAQCAWLLLYKVAPADRKTTKVVGVIFALYCLVAAARIVEFLAGRPVRADFFQPGASDAVAALAYQILFIILTYALMLMFNKRLVEDLQTGEEKFSSAFHSSPYAVIISRLSDGLIMEVNDGFLEITGYRKEEVQGKTSFELNLWRREEDRAEVIRELSQNKSVRHREYLFRKKNGEILSCIFSAELITVHHEACILSSINDITDRKNMESELHKSELLLRSVMDNLPIGVAVNSVDPSVKFQYINDNFTALYRTTKEAILEKGDFWEAVYEDAQYRDEIKNRVMSDCASGDPKRMVWEEVPITRKGLETVYVSARNIPIPSGKLMISTVWDVTGQKKIQREIQSLNQELGRKVEERTKELHDSQLALLNLVDDLNETSRDLAAANSAMEAANRELEAFSYSVSHDLRAPLRTIDGFGQALVEDYANRLDETGQNYLARMRRATQHMGRLIDDILKLSRVTRADFNRAPIDLSRLAETISQLEQINHPDRAADVLIQEGLTVMADHNLIEIALTNLIGNAWKFTGKTAHPRIEFGSSIEGGRQVFFIRDNGVGFDMAYAHKLFGTFQRLHKQEDFDGTGVGLATVKRIITRHGGEIWARGEIGAGTTFFFTIPP